MKKKIMSTALKAAAFACAVGFISIGSKMEADAQTFLDKNGKEVAAGYNGWSTVQGDTSGKKYWFDNGILARSKEVYDSESDAWYWFDEDGTMAAGKDVFVPTNEERTEGKWVRYDENGGMIKGENYANGGWYRFDEITGVMIKGWYTNSAGFLYYYDDITGQMAHGARDVEGVPCAFDDNTGVALNCQWYTINGDEYWYENGVRQGLEGRGKEIYDPATNAWYWLDSIDGGRKAKGKDVYQESNGGKWVRYDENGGMIKGWDIKDSNVYYFDEITGAMTKGEFCDTDGYWYLFDENTGIMQTGHIFRNNNWYYYHEEYGYMVKGPIKIDGYTYKYDEITGVLIDKYEGDINFDGLVVTFQDEFEVHNYYSLSGTKFASSVITAWHTNTKHYSDDTYRITLECTILIKELRNNNNFDYIKCELIDENDVCIKNGYILLSYIEVNKKYIGKISFDVPKPGKYTLKFSDYYH